MSITSKQLTYLNEMDIQLWQKKDQLKVQNVPKESCTEQTLSDSLLTISLDELQSKQLFLDVLRSLNCSLDDISQQEKQLDLAQFKWQFSENEDVILIDNILTTPSLETISHCVELKKALWQTLNNQILELSCH